MDETGEGKQDRSRRIRKRFVLRAAVHGEDPPKWSYCTIHNLSASGILFTYDRLLVTGSYLHLKIDFPDRLVECVGQVMRVVGRKVGNVWDLGVRFIELHHLDQKYIERFVDSYKER